MNIWHSIQSEIEKATKKSFSLTDKIPVSGGDINQAFHLIGDKAEYFVKLNTSHLSDMFVQESVGLKELELSKSMIIPKVILHGIYKGQSYLVLEYLSMQQQGDIRDFACALAKLHLNTFSHFGFQSDNYIGKTPQINQYKNDWGRFFAEQRIGFQIELLKPKNISQSLIRNGDTLIKKMPDILNSHQPKPALVHGDLWQGNYAFNQNGKPIIFDPACYYADHEVDLAMLELFGNPGDAFFEAYDLTYKIDKGYSTRKKIYNLYHILNHANLFGGNYIFQSEQILNELVDLI